MALSYESVKVVLVASLGDLECCCYAQSELYFEDGKELWEVAVGRNSENPAEWLDREPFWRQRSLFVGCIVRAGQQTRDYYKRAG